MKLTGIVVVALLSYVYGHINVNHEKIHGDDIYRVSFFILISCDKKNTTSLVFTIPENALVIKAQQLPGFATSSTTRVVEHPYLVDGVNETMDTLTFTGNLPGDEFQIFSLLLQARDSGHDQQFKFNITQHCGTDYKIEWNGDESSEHPAPVIEIRTSSLKISVYGYIIFAFMAIPVIASLFFLAYKICYNCKLILVRIYRCCKQKTTRLKINDAGVIYDKNASTTTM